MDEKNVYSGKTVEEAQKKKNFYIKMILTFSYILLRYFSTYVTANIASYV